MAPGKWLAPANIAECLAKEVGFGGVAAHAGAQPMYRQNEKLLEYVLTKPKDRVSYSMLTPADEDLQKIEDMALQMGIMKKPVKMSDLIDREFIPKTIEPAEIKVAAK